MTEPITVTALNQYVKGLDGPGSVAVSSVGTQ